MLRNKYIKIAFFAFLCLAMFSCRAKKSVTEIGATETKSQKNENSAVYNCVVNNEPSFSTFEAKATLNMDYNGKSYNVKSTIKILNDSCAFISLQPFVGIELVRVWATPNRIVVIDRINSNYYEATYDEIRKMTGLFADYQTLQSLLCDRLFLTGISKEKLSKNMFEISSSTDGYLFKSNSSLVSCPYLFQFSIDKNCRVCQTFVSEEKRVETLSCRYSNFMQIEKYQIPFNLEFTSFDGKKMQKMNVIFTKVELNKDINVDLSIPSKYKKGDVSKLDSLF